MNTNWDLRISDEHEDPTWDEFVASVPGGHHVQTSLWAKVKACLGWEAFRIIVKQGGQIIGGAQVLLHPYPLVGSAGYVTKGPLLRQQDPELAEYILLQLSKISRNRHVQLLAIQPPNDSHYMTGLLEKQGFRLSTLELAPVASILIDVQPEPEEILGQMKRQTRQNIRRSIREGVTFREGTLADLHTFYDLHISSSQRQHFLPYPFHYFETMGQVLEPHGYFKLLLTEYEGQAVSAFLLVPFHDTVIAKILGWSGMHREHRPNEALAWGAILWAKENGYRYFDFEGIDQDAAQYLLNGESLPESMHSSPNFFKYGFGGKIVLYPPAYDYLFSPPLRWIYNRIPLKVATQSMTSKVLDRLRKR